MKILNQHTKNEFKQAVSYGDTLCWGAKQSDWLRAFFSEDSRTRFFPVLWFLLEVKTPLVTSSRKKRTNEWIQFLPYPQKPRFGAILGTFWALLPCRDILQKIGLCHFMTLNLIKKSVKATETLLRYCVMNERKNSLIHGALPMVLLSNSGDDGHDNNNNNNHYTKKVFSLKTVFI